MRKDIPLHQFPRDVQIMAHMIGLAPRDWPDQAVSDQAPAGRTVQPAGAF